MPITKCNPAVGPAIPRAGAAASGGPRWRFENPEEFSKTALFAASERGHAKVVHRLAWTGHAPVVRAGPARLSL